MKVETRRQQKQALSLKSMAFNRFLWFRYVTAGFFFTNLYWLILLSGQGYYWLLPAGLLLVHGAVTVEQSRKYWHPDHDLPVTRAGYWAQMAVNLVLLFGIPMNASAVFFPFFNPDTQLAVGVMLLGGLGLCGLIQRLAWLIAHDRDRYLQRLRDFEASLR